MLKIQMLLLMSCLSIVSGCLRQNGFSAGHKRITNSEKSLEIVRNYEAFLTDVPVPLDVQLMSDMTTVPEGPEAFMAVFQTSQVINDLIIFYDREMERNGWQKACQVQSGTESLGTFYKPSKICTISLRRQINKKLKPDAVTMIYLALGDNMVSL